MPAVSTSYGPLMTSAVSDSSSRFSLACTTYTVYVSVFAGDQNRSTEYTIASPSEAMSTTYATSTKPVLSATDEYYVSYVSSGDSVFRGQCSQGFFLCSFF